MGHKGGNLWEKLRCGCVFIFVETWEKVKKNILNLQLADCVGHILFFYEFCIRKVCSGLVMVL